MARAYTLYISVPEFIDPVLGVKMIVFVKISPKCSYSIQSVPTDASLSLFWKRSDWGVVFKYSNCVEEEMSRFSCSKSGHIRWRIFTKSVEFAKVNVVQRLISYYRNKFFIT